MGIIDFPWLRLGLKITFSQRCPPCALKGPRPTGHGKIRGKLIVVTSASIVSYAGCCMDPPPKKKKRK